jgi:hypothetical protein
MANAAAAPPKSVVCPSCGFNNSPPPANGRCISCGSSMESMNRQRSREEELERRYQQEGFSPLWMIIAIVVQAVLTGALVIGLPMVIPALDFEGGNGMLVAIPVWFLGGLLVGLISPGKTFTEPVVASFFVAMPTVFYLVRSETVRTLPTFMYIIMATIGVLFTLIGSYIGERIQMGPPPKKAD